MSEAVMFRCTNFYQWLLLFLLAGLKRPCFLCDLNLFLLEPLEFNSSDLTFTYAPSRQITCAINAKNAHYVWSMNTAGPYPNQREVQFNGSQCSGCNASASRRVQCAQATLGKCIQTTSQENVVVVQFGCYGCLRCTATVPYGNESQVGFYDYGLTQPYDTTPGELHHMLIK